MTAPGPVRQYLGMSSGAIVLCWAVNVGHITWECVEEKTWKEAYVPVCTNSKQALIAHMICAYFSILRLGLS